MYVKEPAKSDSFSAELSRIAHVSSVLEDLGYASFETQQSLKEVLSDFPELKELDVAMVLCYYFLLTFSDYWNDG